MLRTRTLLILIVTGCLLSGCRDPETRLTEENYYRITLGMSYAEVYAILGGQEADCRPPEEQASDLKQKVCKWKASSGPSNEFSVYFLNGKVRVINATNLRPSEEDQLTRKNYNRLAVGMTYAEVYSVLGSKGTTCHKPDIAQSFPRNGRCEWEASPRFLEPSPVFRVYFRDDKVTAFEALHLK